MVKTMRDIVRKLRRCAVYALLITFCLACAAAPAGAENFKTGEYLRSTGLEALQAADAYALGFTGKGVTVGVIDTRFAPAVDEFAGKYPYGVFSYAYDKDDHGIHVAGIIAAAKDNMGMHGAAFDSTLLPSGPLGYSAQALQKMLEYPDVRIISNSWGANLFLDQSEDFDTLGIVTTGTVATPEYISNYHYPYTPPDNVLKDWTESTEDGPPLLKLAEADKLLVFAAGNAGHLSPGVNGALPSLAAEYAADADDAAAARNLRLHWLNVSAFDPAAYDPTAPPTRLGPDFVAAFTDMGLFASDYTLWAPGVDIDSTIAADAYKLYSGTSMAAPYVAGVAALAQSAFPYMGGKQLADVLLSTAAPLTLANVPEVFALYRVEYSDDGEDVEAAGVVVYKLDGHTIDMTDERDAMLGALKKYLSNWDATVVESKLDAALAADQVKSLAGADYLSLFGAGIVNAFRAVQGPGYFDANRLDNADLDTYGGTDYALYPVDSKGYDSIWSNDIGQKIVPAGATITTDEWTWQLAGLPVGLRKQGDGMLYLTGENTYEGPTVVDGGGISLGRTGQADGLAKVFGDVYVNQGGMFTGNGAVGGDLTSSGLLFPGLSDTPSVLTVGGAVQSDGELRLRLWADGQANRLSVGGVGGMDIDGTRVSIAGMDGGGSLPQGSFEVVSASSGIIGSLANYSAQALQGATLLHDFNLRLESTSMYADYQHSAASPRAKALPESFLGGLTLLNQGADMVAGPGMAEAAGAARRSAKMDNGRGYGLATFSAISAGQSRYDTGSHVDVNSVSLLTGLAAGFETSPGFLTLGVFFEVGYGDYDTYNSFSNAASVRGKGETYHMGGGVVGRMDFKKSGPGSFYVEASGRAGAAYNEYASGDLADYKGRAASYDTRTPYFGLHGGLGYVWKLSDEASLDLYGKYFWTRQNGSSMTLSTKDPVHFSAADSHRLRGGARFTYAINEYVSPYIGAAYEHEFDGRAKATTYGYAIQSPNLRGDTGLGELGFSLRPSPDLPISFDLGGQLYTGKREGVSGSVQMKYEF